MKTRNRKTDLIFEVAILAGFIGIAGGFLLGGGALGEVSTEQYVYGENISVNVQIADLGIDQDVTIYSGMTPFDALLRVTSLKTDYYDSMGASVVSEVGGLAQFWGFSVNGEVPSQGMQDVQLNDGDNLELYALTF